MLCPPLPSTLIQKTEYQVPNRDLKQIFKLVPDSANRLLLIERRLILGPGLAKLMPGCCVAHSRPLHRCSPVVSRAAVEALQPQISVRERGRAICGRACSAGTGASSSQTPGARTLLCTLIRSFGASQAVPKFRRELLFGKVLLETSTTAHWAWWPPVPGTSSLHGTKALGEAKPRFPFPFLSLPDQSLAQRLHTGNGTTLSALLSLPTQMPT